MSENKSMTSHIRCKDTYKKWSSLVGGWLMTTPLGLVFFWGNLYVYAGSFLIERLHTEHGVQGPWVLTLKACLTSMVGLLGPVIDRWIGKRTRLMAGLVILGVSYGLSYVAIQTSDLAFVLTFGGLYGVGDGLVLFVVMDFTLEWVEEEKAGVYLSVGYSGMYVGGALANQAISRYINPHNDTPDHLVSNAFFFTEKDILDRIPRTFLYLAAGYFCLQLVGFLLLRSKDEQERYNDEINDNDTEERTFERQYKTFSHSPKHVSNGDQINAIIDDSKPNNLMIPPSPHEDKNTSGKHTDYLTTREMLQTRQFYLLFVSFVFNYQFMILANNYYKSLGETWITDDRFLSNLGSVLPVTTTVCCIVWGFLLDAFPLKTCLVSLSGALSLVCIVYRFIPPLGRWPFSAFTVLFVSTSSAVFSIYSIATVKTFGKTHQSSNFSVIYSATLTTLVFSPLTEAILLRAGWSFMFLTFGALNTLSMICFVLWF